MTKNYDDVEEFIINEIQGPQTMGTVIDMHVQMQIMFLKRNIPHFNKSEFFRQAIKESLARLPDIEWPKSLEPHLGEGEDNSALSPDMIAAISRLTEEQQNALLILLAGFDEKADK